MASIGSFGAPRPVEDDAEGLDFDYFGTTIRVDPAYTDADIIDFMETASTIDEQDPRSGVAVKDAVRAAIHPDDFDTFWRLARENRQSIEDRMNVLMAIVEAVGRRPTQRPAGSSGGPRTTPSISEGGSSSRVLSRLDGRRDLQLLVADAQVHQEQRTA